MSSYKKRTIKFFRYSIIFSKHPNKKEIIQIITENNNNFRRTTNFKIIKKIIKGQELSKLIMCEDFEEMQGRLNGLINRRL